MKTYYFDEQVAIWKRTRVSVPDEVTEEEFIEQCKGNKAYKLEKEHEDWKISEAEYLEDTEWPIEDLNPDEPHTEIINPSSELNYVIYNE